MGIFGKMAISHRGLRYKMFIAFSLMSVIPLLACVYVISSYIFPQLDTLVHVSVVLVVAVVIAILGLFLARGLINPVIDMAIEAKIIASGEYDRSLVISSDDEVGNLALSINAMTREIRSNIDELKGYGQRMRDINIDIHKKVLTLSSLLQIGDLIAAGGSDLDQLLEMAVGKASMIFDTGYGVLYMPKEEGGDFTARIAYSLEDEKLNEMVIKKDGSSVIEKALESRAMIVLDKAMKVTDDIASLKSAYGVKNALIMALYSGRQNLGLLLIGNRLEDFRFKTDDIELIKVFAKQITIAIETDILSKKSEILAIKDELTDLYNKNFILVRLEEEIKRAIFYQRPCSFIVFNIDDFRKFREAHGELAAEETLRRLAKLIRDNMIPVGKAARIGADEFAILLPEKNKKQAAYIAEEIRKKVELTNLLREGSARLTVSGGVSENPLDGATADELFKKAVEAVKQAKSEGKNRVAA